MPQPTTAEPRAAQRPGRRLSRVAAALCVGLLPLLSHAAQPNSSPKAAAPAADEGFPRSALEIRSAGGRQWFTIRIADTEARRELGLMFVTKMPSDEGMLFPEDHPQVMSMWMKNTYIPLDMLFIDTRGHVVCLIANAKPESLDILSCDKPAKAVLEINGGEAQRRGIKVGDVVVHATFHP